MIQEKIVYSSFLNSSNESDDKTKKKFKKKSSKGSDDSDSDDELVPSDEKRPKGAKLFALDIFDSSREQHEEANNESLIFEVRNSNKKMTFAQNNYL